MSSTDVRGVTFLFDPISVHSTPSSFYSTPSLFHSTRSHFHSSCAAVILHGFLSIRADQRAFRHENLTFDGIIRPFEVSTEGSVYRFGPFELDSSRRALHRGAQAVFLPDRALDVLLLLVSRAGQVVVKQDIFDNAWHDVAVTDNSIVQAITGLRKVLGTQPGGVPSIETAVRRGYRFAAPVERAQARTSSVAFDAVLYPHRAFVDGRAALETLDRDAVLRARDAFEQALGASPDLVPAHVGIANAAVMLFESARFGGARDPVILQQAEHHAREACRLDPASGDPWSTLAFVIHLTGNSRDAVAAAHNAISLEPDDWRHHLSLAFVSWGEERLRAARKLSKLRPGLALAHWLAATVFIARQAFDAALTELRAGCTVQDAQRKDTGRFNIVGLHLLHGQVLAAQGLIDEALQELDRELASHDEGHIYAQECYANCWYSIGAIRLRHGTREEAETALQKALALAPGHALAGVAMTAVSPAADRTALPVASNPLDTAIIHAAMLALRGNPIDAARVCGEAIAHAGPGCAGWVLPIDPLFQPTAHGDAWAQTLAMLRDRAT